MGDGPWDWTCAGAGNGEKAHCFALPSDVLFANPARDQRGVLLKEVYAGIFGSPPAETTYLYWVEKYNPSAGVTCSAIVEAFLLDSSSRAAAATASTADDPALTGYIEMLYPAHCFRASARTTRRRSPDGAPAVSSRWTNSTGSSSTTA